MRVHLLLQSNLSLTTKFEWPMKLKNCLQFAITNIVIDLLVLASEKLQIQGTHEIFMRNSINRWNVFAVYFILNICVDSFICHLSELASKLISYL